MPNESTPLSSDVPRSELKALQVLIVRIKDQAAPPVHLVPTATAPYTPPAKPTWPLPQQRSSRGRPRTARNVPAFAPTPLIARNLPGSPLATPPTCEVNP